MATLLKERSTYWVRSGGSSYNTYFDYRGYWKIYYEQSEADKKLLRTKLIVDYYLQTHRQEDAVGIADSTSLNVLINGSSIGTVSANTNTVEVGNKLIKKGSKSTYIYHNADGTASFTFQGKGFGSNTAVSTYSLPKLNVGTSITNNSSGYIDFGSNVTFTLTKPVESHLNTLYFKIGDTTYTIASSTSDTSVNYAFNEDLIVNYPDNEKISLTVYCKNETSGIETSTTVYLSVPSSYVPSASLAIADVMANKPSVLDGLWIKNQSQLKGTISASGIKGSSIKSYLSSISGFSQQYNTNPFTTQPLTVAGSRTITTTVTDSRDRKKTITQNINVIDYAKPTITSLSVKRCLEDGTLSESGTWAKVICKYSISPINNLNTKTLKIYLNGAYEDVNTLSSYSGEFSKVVYANIKQDQSYAIKAVLSDLFGDVPQEFLLGVAYKTVSKRAGGKGITFGGVATQDGFHNYMPSRFYDETRFDDNVIIGSGISSDPTNSFQSSLFGKLDYYWRFKVIRSEIGTNANFPQYSTGIAFTGGDTHGYIMPNYSSPNCYIGGGNGDQLNWIKQVAWKEDDWQTIWTGTLLGGNTLNLNVASYSKLKVYATCHSVNFNFEVDLMQPVSNTQVTGYDYCGADVVAYMNKDEVIEHHSCEVIVNTAKTEIFNRHMGYVKGSTTNLRNNSSHYYIYKIEAK